MSVAIDHERKGFVVDTARAANFRDLDAFRRYLRRLPIGYVFGPGTSLERCPMAIWARTFRRDARVACVQVAWDGSFSGPRVERVAAWQEAFSRRALLYTLSTGQPVSRERAIELLETAAPPAERHPLDPHWRLLEMYPDLGRAGGDDPALSAI